MYNFDDLRKKTVQNKIMDFDILIDEKIVKTVKDYVENVGPAFFSDLQDEETLKRIKLLCVLNILNYLDQVDVDDTDQIILVCDSIVYTIYNLLTVEKFSI